MKPRPLFCVIAKLLTMTLTARIFHNLATESGPGVGLNLKRRSLPRDEDQDPWKQDSSAYETRDLGLEVTSLPGPINFK